MMMKALTGKISLLPFALCVVLLVGTSTTHSAVENGIGSETSRLEGRREVAEWFESAGPGFLENDEAWESELLFESPEWESSTWTPEARENVYEGISEEIKELLSVGEGESQHEGRQEWLRENKKSDYELQREEATGN